MYVTTVSEDIIIATKVSYFTTSVGLPTILYGMLL